MQTHTHIINSFIISDSDILDLKITKEEFLEYISQKKDKEIICLLDSHHSNYNNNLFFDIIIELNDKKDNKTIQYLFSIPLSTAYKINLSEKLIIYSVRNKNNAMVYWLLDNTKISIHLKQNFIFRTAIKFKNLQLAKKLYNKYDASPFDINCRAIILAFELFYNTKHKNIFNWLWNLKDVKKELKLNNEIEFIKIQTKINFMDF